MSFLNTYINGCIPPINSFNQPTCSSSSDSSSSTSSNQIACINNVYSLINYTYSYSPSNEGIGLIRYNNINVTNSSVGNRIWNFTYGGYVEVPIFTTRYQFDPNCYIPNNVDNTLLKDLNFLALDGSGTQEPVQGFIIINNVNIPLSDAFNTPPYNTSNPLASFSYSFMDFKATFDLRINLTAQLQNIHFKKGGQNSIFVNLWIQDASSTCSPACGTYSSCKGGKCSAPSGGRSCLSPGSRIKLSDGTYQRIEDLHGHESLYYNGVETSQIRFILKKPSGVRNYYNLGNGSMVTDDHPIFDEQSSKWILPGDKYNLESHEHKSIYLIQLENDHDYFYVENTRCVSWQYTLEKMETKDDNELLYRHHYRL